MKNRSLTIVLVALCCLTAVSDTHAEAHPRERLARNLRFAGFSWQVVHSTELRGPGPNIFDARNVHIDEQGRLVLETVYREGRWTSAHVFLRRSLGYGTYELRLAPIQPALDERTVFGFFTWDDDPEFANREIDIEFSRWGNPDSPNLSFVVQPAEPFPNRVHLAEFDPGQPTILRFTWTPQRVDFLAQSATEQAHWSFAPQQFSTDGQVSLQAPFGVPPSGSERVGINLWLFRGAAPQWPARVVVESFRFERWSRDSQNGE